VGESWLACALAQMACRDNYLSLYTRAAAQFRDLALAHADGSVRNLLARLSRVDVLVVDDWAMAPMQETERRGFWEICEGRYQTRSTILTSQVLVAQFHEQIGDHPEQIVGVRNHRDFEVIGLMPRGRLQISYHPSLLSKTREGRRVQSQKSSSRAQEVSRHFKHL